MKQLIEQATDFLKEKIRNTPVEFSSELSKLLGQAVYLKLECLQMTGSFKLRGLFFIGYDDTLDWAAKGAAKLQLHTVSAFHT